MGGKAVKKRSFLIVILLLSILLMGVLASCKDKEEPLNVDANITVTDGEADGLNVALNVGEDVENIDLASIITASEGASWKVFEDAEAQTEVSLDAAINLQDGENIYYVVVTSEDGGTTQMYTIKVFKNYYVTISYMNGETVYKTENALINSVLGAGPAGPTREGYDFAGWDSEGHVVTEPARFTAKWTVKKYALTLSKNIAAAGTVQGDGDKDYGSSVTVTATTNEGYIFAGWYDGDNKVSTGTETSYTFTMPATLKTLQARWNPEKYPVALNNTNDLAGTLDGAGSYDYNTSLEIKATPNPGYKFEGWYENNSLVTMSMNYTFSIPISGKIFTAKWSILSYTLSLDRNIEAAGTVQRAGTYDYNARITVTATTTNEAYIWDGWYDGNTKVSVGTSADYTFNMPADDKTLVAKWTAKTYSLTLNRNLPRAGTVEGAESYEYNSSVQAKAITNPGYTWKGWYENEVKITDAEEYTFNMPASARTIEARWEAQKFMVTLNKNIDAAGEISGAGERDCGTNATIQVTVTNEGYEWIGWYSSGDELKTTSPHHTFAVPAYNITLTAKWTVRQYNMVFESNGGSAVATITQGYGTAVTKPIDPTKTGYTFDCWCSDSGLTAPYTITTMPVGGIKLYAKWNINQYTLTLSKNIADAGNVTGAGDHDYNSQVPLTATTTDEGYTFLGWYDGSSRLSTEANYTYTMPASPKTLTAMWTPKQHTLSLNKNINVAGVVTGGGSKEYNSSVTINATTNAGYTFDGWYENDTKIVGALAEYTFTMPNSAKTLEARWKPYQRIKYNNTPDPAGNYVLFGEYPQTVELNLNNIDITGGEKADGYYRGVDGITRYKKVTAQTYGATSNYWFTGQSQQITHGTAYYFKVEPLKWRILATSDNKALIVCETIIDHYAYNASSGGNRYIDSSDLTKSSDLIKWLNSKTVGREGAVEGTVYGTALNYGLYKTFSTLQQALIEETVVQNGKTTTHSPESNSYACNDTTDKIFALSYQEIANGTYFPSVELRTKLTSDYARATGAYMTQSGTYGAGWWWLRSPRADASNRVSIVDQSGTYDGVYKLGNTQGIGIVPALRLNIG